MTSWQQRVIHEHQDLNGKIVKLVEFLEKGMADQMLGDHVHLTAMDRVLLGSQLTHMLAYSGILATRINRFS